jgi:hypothetical protein
MKMIATPTILLHKSSKGRNSFSVRRLGDTIIIEHEFDSIGPVIRGIPVIVEYDPELAGTLMATDYDGIAKIVTENGFNY